MTHLNPSAVPSASSPPRESGPGADGRPQKTRRLDRVRIHCAPLLAILIALLASAATAQIIPTGSPAADILLTTALAEHQQFLTCSSLEPMTHGQITQNWQRDVTAAAAILTANKVAPEAVKAFTEAARPESLLPVPGTPFEEVEELCADSEWMKRYYEFNLIVLELKLPEAFK